LTAVVGTTPQWQEGTTGTAMLGHGFPSSLTG
jgi:hypothetical protein